MEKTQHSHLERCIQDPVLGAGRLAVGAGAILYRPDEPAQHLYLVQQGQVRTYRPSEGVETRLLEILGPGDWCGEAALAQQETYGEQAAAVTAAVVWQVAATRLIERLARQPELAAELMRQLAGKLSAARRDAAELVFADCRRRLLRTLLRFSGSSAASPTPQGVVLHITHQQLAQAVGVARETVSLALTHLRHEKLLRTGRNQLTFNPDELRTAERAVPAATH